jgi:hypothetical protein
MGWPVICTDIHPYQNAPVTRLPNEPEKWIKAIREQLAEPQALREAGLALQRWVRDGFILENHVASWFAAYGPEGRRIPRLKAYCQPAATLPARYFLKLKL